MWRTVTKSVYNLHMSTTSIKASKQMPIEQLREVFEIVDGVVVWKKCNVVRFNGQPAGYVSKNGYVDVNYLGTRFYVHRIAFALHHGRWPDGLIDQIDRNRQNNCPENLREVCDSQNSFNLSKRVDNKSGVTGVSKHTGGWHAEISAFGKRHRKWFKSKLDAIDWISSLRLKLHLYGEIK